MRLDRLLREEEALADLAVHEALGDELEDLGLAHGRLLVELARRRRERARAGAGPAGKDAVVSPMQGTVLAVEVAEGDEVAPGQVLCVVEAMKMENEITAHRAGAVTELSVEAGQPVSTGQVICVVRQEGDAAE